VRRCTGKGRRGDGQGKKRLVHLDSSFG
jgi:hypothetical protein